MRKWSTTRTDRARTGGGSRSRVSCIATQARQRVITNDGRAKILDFGPAELTRSDTRSTTGREPYTASPAWCWARSLHVSRTVARPRTPTRAPILFSSARLYEMVPACALSKAIVATSSAPSQREPQDLVDINTSVSPALDRIVRHCLEKNPAERFQSAHDLASISRPQQHQPELEGTAAAAGTENSRVGSGRWSSFCCLALAGAAFFLGHSRRAASMPVFHQLTHRTGTVYEARFTTDGNSVALLGSLGGQPGRTVHLPRDSVESRTVAPKTLLAAVSSRINFAVLLEPRLSAAGSVSLADGTLAVLPLEGGAARP